MNLDTHKIAHIQIIYMEDSIFVYIGDNRGEINNLFLAIKTPYVH